MSPPRLLPLRLALAASVVTLLLPLQILVSLALRLLDSLAPFQARVTGWLRASYAGLLWLLEARTHGEAPEEPRHKLVPRIPFLLRLARDRAWSRPLLALVHARATGIPLHRPMGLPSAQSRVDAGGEEAATPARSVAFFRHSYYNFFFLAQALRRRGWDAIVVNPESPDGPNERYFFGQDLRTFDVDPAHNQANLRDFLARVARDYRMLHFHGIGGIWVFPEHSALDSIPWEILELKDRGVKLGFTVSGCLDMVSQTSFRSWSGDLCAHCAWRPNPQVCTDQRNLVLGQKVVDLCDLVCNEGESLLDLRVSPQTYLEPLTGAIDPDFWHPELEIPEDRIRPREPGEFVVYHALGNAADRLEDGADVKGSRVILQAIENLRAEGHKIRLDFVTNLPSREVRYAQLQADVVVDQIRYGRWGATARESMMLGKPVVAHVNPDGGEGHACSRAIAEAPVVSANPATIETVLRELMGDRERREELGRKSRQHALEWWSADACAARYEAVYDRLMSGLNPLDELPRTLTRPREVIPSS